MSAANDNFVPRNSPHKASAAALDKFYTAPAAAAHCCDLFRPFIPSNAILIEPSAGSGAFLNVADREIVGFDIAPEARSIITADFLTEDVRDHLTADQARRKLAVIGNPPFGPKAALAIQFLGRALALADVVGFILPVQARKWSFQSKIDPAARLLLDETLPDHSFEFMGQPYAVRACFQVWSKADLRMKFRPPVAHPDFKMWQFNRTRGAEKFFEYDWDFAVPRQGYQDYSIKARSGEECDRRQQWAFFKARDEQVLRRLLALDFAALAQRNTCTPGFGKADVVAAYCQIADNDNSAVTGERVAA